MIKQWITCFATLAMCACIGGTVTQQKASADTTNSSVCDMFLPANIQVEPMCMDSEALYMERGIRITSNDKQEFLEWKDTICGDFTFDYLPLKTSNQKYSAQTLEVVFQDSFSNDSFSLVIKHGETSEAYLAFNGIQAGIFYFKAGEESGLTQLGNNNEEYTQFNAGKIRVRFNPYDMSVYVGSAESEQVLVWNMLQSENDGCDVGETLSPFINYTVSFGITQFLEDEGSILLYSVNGAKLDGLFLQEKTTPVIYADVAYDGVVGAKYTLPTAYAYDVADGIIEAERISNKIYYNGNAVYENVQSFTPSVAGDYVIEYQTQNTAGVFAKESYVVTVYENMPAYETNLDWNLQDEYVTGSQVIVPTATLYEGLRKYGSEKGKLTIYKNGIPLRAYSDVCGGFTYTFRTVGKYRFAYDVGEETLDYTVNVVDGTHAFICDGLQSSYVKDTFLDCSSFALVFNGQKTDYQFSVTFPSGKRLANDKFVVDEIGQYVIVAEKTVEGQTVSFKRSFNVYATDSQTFVSSSNKVSIGYGKSIFTGREGVVVTSSQAGTLVESTQPIDISKYVGQTQLVVDDKNNTNVTLSDTAKPFMEFSIDPLEYGVEAAKSVNVYLTDATDPENKITIVIKSENSKKFSYIRACAPKQELSGWDNSKNIRSTKNFGFLTLHSFKGMLVDSEKTTDTKIALYYDYETKQLLSQSPNKAANHIINDFDDPKYTGGGVWNGFSSNQVYVSFEIIGLTASACDMIIYQFDGKPLTDNPLIYNAKPTVTVASDDLLTGAEGYSLSVPQATATDCTGTPISNIIYKVYYQNGERLYDVSVINGRFATKRSGRYYIVYQAWDCFGNVGEKIVSVDVEENVADWSVVWLDGDVPDEYKSGTVGASIPFYGLENINVQGEYGKTQIVRKVYRLEGTNRVEVEETDGALVAKQAGTYLVEYQVMDELGRVSSCSYEVEISCSSNPIIVSSIPEYVGFIRGNDYVIHDVYYIVYDNANATAQKADVYINGVKYNQSTFALEKVVEDENATETVETVNLRYQENDNVLLEYEIPVKTVYKQKTLPGRPIKTTRFLQERYFLYEDGNSVTAKTNHLVLSTNDDENLIKFVQAISISDLELAFDVDFEKNSNLEAISTNLLKLNVYLTDATDISKQLKLSLFMDNGALIFALNDDYASTGTLSGSLTGTSIDGIRFKYSVGTNMFYDVTTSTKLIAPKTYVNGKPFEGFGKTVFVSFEMERAGVGETSIRLYSIGNQTFSNNETTDDGEPTITVDKELSGVFNAGETLIIPSATVSDVLSSIADEDFTVTVTLTKDGVASIVHDVNGLALENVSAQTAYEIVLSSMGDYRIFYQATDCRGVVGTKEYVVTAIMRRAPTITLNGKMPTSTSIGATVSLPSATVQFMETNDTNLTYVIYIAPSGQYYTVKGGKFVATEKGEYTVRYYALDAYGNYSMEEYIIKCK